MLLVMLAGVAVIDWRKGIIPDWLNALIAVTGLLVLVPAGLEQVGFAILEAAVAGAMGLLLRWAYFRFRGIQGLGLGDVKFVAAATPWIGLAALPAAMLIASLAALGGVLIVRLSGQKLLATSRIPFGPFLAFGTAAVRISGLSG